MSRWLFLIAVLGTLCGKIPERVLICGVCKDVERELPRSIEFVEAIGDLFEEYQVLVYENNSRDRTLHILKEWQAENRRVHLKFERLPRGRLNQIAINRDRKNRPFRPEVIARARNQVLDMASRFPDYDYILWMDLDFYLDPPNYQAIVEVFQSDREWDAVLANGVAPTGRCVDWYSVRTPEYPLGPELLGMDWYTRGEQRESEFILKESDPWKRVYSAFGGFGIYRRSSIEGCRYSGVVTPDMERVMSALIATSPDHPEVKRYHTMQRDQIVRLDWAEPSCTPIKSDAVGIVLGQGELVWRMNSFAYQHPSVCEHVPFHCSMIINGHNKIYINPRLFFYY